MTALPLVSVVIPAYNAEKWIDDCIYSVLKQDYPNIEIVVVNDASTDGTLDKVVKIMNTIHNGHIILASNFVNEGECITSYNGFDLATGKYICRLSADDLFVARVHISEQVAAMEQSGADWCYNSLNVSGEHFHSARETRSMWLPIPTRFCTATFQKFDNFILRHPYIALVKLMIGNCVNSSTLMVSRDCYSDVKWCKEYRTDCDGAFLFRLLLKKKVGVAVKSVGVFYRIHPDQASCNPGYTRDMAAIRTRVRTHVSRGDYPMVKMVFVREGV